MKPVQMMAGTAVETATQVEGWNRLATAMGSALAAQPEEV